MAAERPIREIALNRIDRSKPDALTSALPEGWVSTQYAVNRAEYRNFLISGMGATMAHYEGINTYQYELPQARIHTTGSRFTQEQPGGNVLAGPLIKVIEPLPNSSTKKFDVKLAYNEMSNGPYGSDLPDEISLTHAAVRMVKNENEEPVVMMLVTPHLKDEGPLRYEVITLYKNEEGIQVSRDIDSANKSFTQIASQLDDERDTPIPVG